VVTVQPIGVVLTPVIYRAWQCLERWTVDVDCDAGLHSRLRLSK